jgi:uncharacterized membrane protein
MAKTVGPMLMCWMLAALWLVTMLVTAWSGAQIPLAAPLPGLLFTLVMVLHGSQGYGWRGFACYFALGTLIGFALEASSIATGFPFGFYIHNSEGPRPFGVALQAPLAYAAVGWPSWMLAKLLTRENPLQSNAVDRFITPLVAALILAGYDFPFDPIGSTVLGLWTFRQPSGQFGVPLSNYLGWLLTGWLIFQLFALLEGAFRPTRHASTKGYWLLPCLIWFGVALQYLILFVRAPQGSVRVGERTFIVADIYEASLAASIFTVLFPCLAAAFRIIARPQAGLSQAPKE